MGDGPNDLGSSRHHILESCENSVRRLGVDHIDIYDMHGFDALTPIEETLSTLDTLVKSGKARCLVCSNFSGWHIMKSLSVSERYRWSRYVGHQVYYSLIGREYEWELMPLALDQKVGALIWSPLGGDASPAEFAAINPSRKFRASTKPQPTAHKWRTNISTKW
jgi:aryl-alcohol dehydrogenase-like predicted oxidoreductase